jgi:hypothetical protein
VSLKARLNQAQKHLENKNQSRFIRVGLGEKPDPHLPFLGSGGFYRAEDVKGLAAGVALVIDIDLSREALEKALLGNVAN